MCFLVDICFSFNQAYYDEDFVIIEDRKIIGCNYIKGWFSVDLIAIIPLDLIIVPAEGESDKGSANKMIRLSRIGRMYKLIKLTRLLRVLKIVKEKSKLLKYV